MRLTILKRIAIFFFVFYLPVQSMAWGVIGHRVVGDIAESYLSSNAKKEIKILLGTETIGMASNWMDFIRSDSNFRYLSTWHYINLKGGLSQIEFNSLLDIDTATNAYTKILFVSKELKNKGLSRDTRAKYLRILIHLVGDIHQPLHVGRPEDLGGNKIKVLWFNENVNLHQVWDERIVNFQQLSYTEYVRAINHTTRSQIKAWQKESLAQWFWDSYQHAEKIYSDVKPDEKLGYNYNFKYIALVNQQLLKGGVHLAGLLNEIFD